jgi:hypothetical protein
MYLMLKVSPVKIAGDILKHIIKMEILVIQSQKVEKLRNLHFINRFFKPMDQPKGNSLTGRADQPKR